MLNLKNIILNDKDQTHSQGGSFKNTKSQITNYSDSTPEFLSSSNAPAVALSIPLCSDSDFFFNIPTLILILK